MAHEKREQTVSGKMLGRTFEKMERWRVQHLLGRKRSEVVGRLLDEVITKMEEYGLSDQPLEHVVRRMRFDPA